MNGYFKFGDKLSLCIQGYVNLKPFEISAAILEINVH